MKLLLMILALLVAVGGYLYFDRLGKIHFCESISYNGQIKTWGSMDASKGSIIEAINAATLICNSHSQGPCILLQCRLLDSEEVELEKKLKYPKAKAPTPKPKKPDLTV